MVVVSFNHQIKRHERIAVINNKMMEDITMKDTKKEVVLNARQVVSGLAIIGLVVCVMATIVGIVSADSHLLGEASSLAVFETIIFCMNYFGAKKDKEAKKNEVVA